MIPNLGTCQDADTCNLPATRISSDGQTAYCQTHGAAGGGR